MTRVAFVGSFDPNFNRNRALIKLTRQIDNVHVFSWSSRIFTENRLDMFRARSLTSFFRIVLGLVKLFWVSFGVALRHPTTIFFVTYPGYFDVPVIWVATRFRRSRIVYDPFISLYDTAVSDRAIVRASSLLARALMLADRFALRASSHVLADTPEQAQFYAGLGDVSIEKISVVWLGADEEVFKPRESVSPGERIAILQKLGLANDVSESTVVLFYGTFVPLQGAPLIVQAAEKLQGSANFLLIGDGQTKSAAVATAQDLGLNNCFFFGPLPQEILVQLIAVADVTLGIFGDSPKAARVIPNKVFEAMACGCDVITAKTPATEGTTEEVILVQPHAEHIAIGISEVCMKGGYRTRLRDTRGEYERLFSERQRSYALQDVLVRIGAYASQRETDPNASSGFGI